MRKFFEGLKSAKSWKSSKLENVDLSDQHGLIAMAEANNKVAVSFGVILNILVKN